MPSKIHYSIKESEVLACFSTPESRRTEAQVYDKLPWLSSRAELRVLLDHLVTVGALKRIYCVTGPWSGCGLYDYENREDIPDSMEDEWPDDPIEFTVGEGDIVVWYQRLKFNDHC